MHKGTAGGIWRGVEKVSFVAPIALEGMVHARITPMSRQTESGGQREACQKRHRFSVLRRRPGRKRVGLSPGNEADEAEHEGAPNNEPKRCENAVPAPKQTDYPKDKSQQCGKAGGIDEKPRIDGA